MKFEHLVFLASKLRYMNKKNVGYETSFTFFTFHWSYGRDQKKNHGTANIVFKL